MRSTLNSIAVLTILVGSWMLVSPQSVYANPDQACCKAGNAECCGDRCESTGTGCSACSGMGCMLPGDPK